MALLVSQQDKCGHHLINILKKTFKIGIKTLKISFLFFILTLIVSLIISGPRKTIFNLWGFYDGYNLIFEYKLSNALEEVKETKIFNNPMNLKEFYNKPIIKVCFQRPYMLQNVFEKEVGHKVDVFSVISDNHGYVIWLFFSDGSISRARPKLHRFLNKSKTMCRDSHFIISFKFDEISPEYLKFYFVKEN